MAVVQTITATILIQVGADEPKPIGTIEIPIELNLSPNKPTGISFPPGVRDDMVAREGFPRGGKLPTRPGPNGEWVKLQDAQVPPVVKIS